jgi:hypothetical protein
MKVRVVVVQRRAIHPQVEGRVKAVGSIHYPGTPQIVLDLAVEGPLQTLVQQLTGGRRPRWLGTCH